MPTVLDALEHIKWLIDKGRSGEKCVVYLPVVEAQRRKVNKEGHKRVVFVTNEQNYGRWHGERDRWTQLCGDNPQIAYELMCECLEAISNEAIQNLYERGSK